MYFDGDYYHSPDSDYSLVGDPTVGDGIELNFFTERKPEPKPCCPNCGYPTDAFEEFGCPECKLNFNEDEALSLLGSLGGED